MHEYRFVSGRNRNASVGLRGFSLRFEQLESRWTLDGSAITIALAYDTGVSATDGITSDPTLTGTVSNGSVDIQFSHTGNGTVNGDIQPFTNFNYNPLANDASLANWEGPLNLAYRVAPVNLFGDVGTFGPWISMPFVLDRVAPTATAIPNVIVTPNSTANTIVPLSSYFHDGYTSDANLSFAVTGSSNAGLFDSVSIDSSHELVLHYASNQAGSAQINVQCTDEAGNATNSVINVLAGAPLISNFMAAAGPGQTYTFTGSVQDDGPVSGLTVTLGGSLASYNLSATVQADGTFSVTQTLPQLHSGTVTAVAQDAHGISSNVAQYFMTVSFVLGDMNGDGVVNNFDIDAYELALTNPSAYLAQYPYMTNYQQVGDINGNGVFNNFDTNAFEQLLVS